MNLPKPVVGQLVYAPIATVVDIGILRIRLNNQWLMMALMGGFC